VQTKAKAVTSPRGNKGSVTDKPKSKSGAELEPWAKVAAIPLQQKSKSELKARTSESAARYSYIRNAQIRCCAKLRTRTV